MSIKNKRCLVLNGSWFPIGIEPASDSIRKVYTGKADVVSQADNGVWTLYNFEDWCQNPDRNNDVITKYVRFSIPEIIRKPYNRLHIKKLPLNAHNIFVRDGFKCWYCGSDEKLTIDHVQPKSRGGKTNWKNLITCCYECNNAKGDISPEKFCIMKGCEMPEPINVGCFPWLKELGKKYPDSWKKWLNFV